MAGLLSRSGSASLRWVKRSGRPRLRPQVVGLVSNEQFLIRNFSAMTLLDQSDLQACRFSISSGESFGSPSWMFVVLGVRIPLLQVAEWQFVRLLPYRRWRDPPTPRHPRPGSRRLSRQRDPLVETGDAGDNTKPAPATTDAEANNHPDPHRPLQYSTYRLGASGTRDTVGSRIPRAHAARCQQRCLSP
jgi:hypothetical protein